jgi:hypothetical protein
MNDNAKPTEPVFSLPNAEEKNQEQWRSFCATLITEIERLRAENVELREQRSALTQMIPIPEDVQQLAGKSFEEFMVMCEGQPSLEDLIHRIDPLPPHAMADQ